MPGSQMSLRLALESLISPMYFTDISAELLVSAYDVHLYDWLDHFVCGFETEFILLFQCLAY